MSAADLRQRAAADPATSAFVTANAGSGKTKVLIDRIARLLLEGAPPASFLCITYTKAAAAEMQRRLFKQLGDWCVAGDDALTTALEKLEGRRVDPSLLPRARGLFAQALESPGGLKIQTIHAFCERLLARFPLEAGVAPGFEIADDADSAAMLLRSWSDVAAHGDEAAQAALARFAARLADDRFQALLRKIVEGRAEMARFLAESGGASAALERLAARHGARASAEEIAAQALRDAPWAELLDAAAALAGSSEKSMEGLAEDIRSAHSARAGEPLAAFAAFKAITFNKDGTVSKKLVTARVKKAHAWVEPLLLRCADLADAAAKAIIAAQRCADAAAAVTLSVALNGAYEANKHRQGVLDFADLIAHALKLLTQADAAPWVLYKLDGGLRHILVDEGQDTSPAQWALIEPMQDEFFAGEGARGARRTMFAVGDPKQSIYSFQGAHPQSFLDQSQRLSGRAAAAERAFAAVTLDTSFRSAPEVLRAVDETFSRETFGGDIPGIYDIVQHVASRANERGRVEWWPAALKPELAPDNPWDAPLDQERPDSAHVKLANELAARIRGWIADGEAVWENGALRAMHAGDVLILVRSRGPLFRQILKALKRAGLPVAGADRMVLKDELAVEDCLTLLRVAVDPADDLALACLLKSPWIGLSDDEADLYPLAAGRAPGETLWSRLFSATEARHVAARAFIETLRTQASAGPFATLAWALERLDGSGRSGWEKMFARLGAESRDPIEEVLARALNAHQRGAATIEAFLAEIARDEAEVKREMEAAGAAVRVMTVHGAKGLEAPVVILPDTTAPARTRYDDDLFFGADGPAFSAAKAEDDPVCARARADADMMLEGEHLRLLYVAMTRARDRLIVCGVARGKAPGKASDKSWHVYVGAAMARIGTAIETPWGEGFALGATARAARAAPVAAAVVPPVWLKTPARAQTAAAAAAPSQLKKQGAALSPRGDGSARFRRGLLLHGLLQRLPDVAPGEREARALRWLARQGAGADEAPALMREALAVVNDPRLARVFGAGSRAEAPIAGEVEGLRVRGVVDRLVVRADEAEILDFKSDRPSPEHPEDAPEGYVLQMALYRAVLSQIFPEKAVRCALIWTEKPLLVELSAAQMEAALAGLRGG